ncbi:MAG: hypothetical protein IPJ31_07475 [Bacteroidetes bacterium]|nr:hypothetical protein [Bacteroidota bacterium]
MGIKLSKNKNWWLDAGCVSSHIGYEGAIAPIVDDLVEVWLPKIHLIMNPHQTGIFRYKIGRTYRFIY